MGGVKFFFYGQQFKCRMWKSFMVISLSVGGAKIFLWSRVKALEAQNFFMVNSLSARGAKFFYGLFWLTV